ncbi:MAG: thermostable hemolysin [Gammaproteobacteria bacterium]|nr:thermostable hemolysin [Gammaproteobacteria bacterium]
MNTRADLITENSHCTVSALPHLGEPRTALALSRHGPHDPLRPVVERFVCERFRHTYGAEIASFCPELISLVGEDQALCAVAGVRPADHERLYSEHYLDVDVETFLAEHTGLPRIPRSSIVEVGNLAPANVGQARWLIATLTAYLYSSGYEWVVFTAIPPVYNAFIRLGLPLKIHTRADATRLPPAERVQWGSYYEAGPAVCYGEIAQGFHQLGAAIRPDRRKLWSLWLEAQRLGNRNDLNYGIASGSGF